MREFKDPGAPGALSGLTDAVTLGGLVFLTVLAVAFNGRIEKPAVLIAGNLLLSLVYAGSRAVLKRIRRKPLRFLLRTGVVQVTFLQVFMTACSLQLIFSGWRDDAVIAWERAIFGTQPLVWIQKFYSPLLNEWMFFVYVVYVVIYPILGAIIYFRRGEDANENYLFHLGLVNLVCSLGFIIYPVASPMHWEKIRALLTKPFDLGPFGRVAEYVRVHIHTPGGSIPSPHCAAATVMWAMALKYTRSGFWLLLPVILSLYVSTVYGRFHYVSDSIIGILAGLATLAAGPALVRIWSRRAERRKGGRP
jgi:membrane-associated phospholipid phosphatase